MPRYFVQLSEAQSAAAARSADRHGQEPVVRALANLARDRHLQEIEEHP